MVARDRRRLLEEKKWEQRKTDKEGSTANDRGRRDVPETKDLQGVAVEQCRGSIVRSLCCCSMDE